MLVHDYICRAKIRTALMSYAGIHTVRYIIKYGTGRLYNGYVKTQRSCELCKGDEDVMFSRSRWSDELKLDGK
jgi:uncharacterized protein (DUF983 family)